MPLRQWKKIQKLSRIIEKGFRVSGCFSREIVVTGFEKHFWG